MTPAEKLLTVVVATVVMLGVILPVDVVELALIVQVVVVAVAAILAGLYISRVARGVTRVRSQYLWLLIRRDKRVAVGFLMLLVLALGSLLPRVLDWATIFQRPWGVLWLIVAIDLFAVGLIDDALLIHRDRSIP